MNGMEEMGEATHIPCKLGISDDGGIYQSDTGSTGIVPPWYIFQEGLLHIQIPSRQQLEEVMVA